MRTRTGRIALGIVGLVLAVAGVGVLVWPVDAPVRAQEAMVIEAAGDASAPSLMQPPAGATIVVATQAEGALLPLACLKPLAPFSDPLSWPLPDMETGENTPAMAPEMKSGVAQEEDYFASTAAPQPMYTYVFEVGDAAIPAVPRGPYLVSSAAFSGTEAAAFQARALRLDASGAAEVIGASQFDVIPAAPDADSDGNGLPDNPFATLATDNSFWFAEVEGGIGILVCAAVRWENIPLDPPSKGELGGPLAKGELGEASAEGELGDGAESGAISLVLRNPDLPDSLVVVEAPRELAFEGETAVLVVAAAKDLATLLGPDVAAEIPVPPTGTLVAGGMYVEISILITTDGGESFDEIDPARLGAYPLWLAMYGIAPQEGEPIDIVSYPTYVDSVPETGLRVIAEEGAWRSDHVANVVVKESGVTAGIVALSVFAPYAGVLEGSDGLDESDGLGGVEETGSSTGTGTTGLFEETFPTLETLGEGGEGGESGGDVFPLAGAMAEVWVDFNYAGAVESGTQAEPFKRLTAGLAEVTSGGTIHLVGGGASNYSDEKPTITQPVRLEAVGGAVRIGGEPAPPEADFTAAPLSGAAPLSVQFTNNSSGGGLALTSTVWDFGDNSPPSTDLDPTHEYATEGKYTVSLTVTNGLGAVSLVRQDYIEAFPATCTLDVDDDGNGSVQLSPPGGTYAGGTVVTLTPQPDTGFLFSKWTGDFTSFDNPLVVTLSGDVSLLAHFVQNPPDIAVGTVTTAPPSTGQNGDTFSVEWSVVNNGFDAQTGWTDAVYLSEDAQFDPGKDKELVSAASQGQNYTASFTPTLPDVAPGNYWLLLKVDAGEVIAEAAAAHGNNMGSYVITIVDPEMNNE